MKNKTPLIIALIILLAGGAYWFYTHQNPNRNTPIEETILTRDEEVVKALGAMETGELSDAEAGVDASVGAVKEFTISSDQLSYRPKSITVKKGDHVKITFNNTGGTHDLKIDEFNVATPIIGAGKSAVIEFDATKTGTFQYYCSVGNHRAQGMFGTLTVTE